MYQGLSIKEEPCYIEYKDNIMYDELRIKSELDSDFSDLELKKEPDEETNAQLEDLYSIYEGHVVKKEMVIGPVELQQPVICKESMKSNVTKLKSFKLGSTKPERTKSESTKSKSTKSEKSGSTKSECFKTKSTKSETTKSDITKSNCTKSKTTKSVKPAFQHRCSLCNQHFDTASFLVTHVQTHTESPHHIPRNNHFKCDTSKEQFKDNGLFKSHTKDHKGPAMEVNHSDAEKMFQCLLCDKSFKIMGHLTRHLRVHTGERPYKCNLCDKTFTQRESAKRHSAQRHSAQRHSAQRHSAQRHSAQRHSAQRHSAQCHTATKNTEKTFPCHICGLKFSRKHDVKDHLRVHSNERPYNCDICDTGFKRKLSLTDHLRQVHAGEKPFRCDVCYKRFSRKLTLTRHKRGHSGEKPFSCASCDKRFSRKWSLATHRCDTHKPRSKQPRVVYSFTQFNIRG